MELKWLKDAVALAECQSFSTAADQRCITQPAFSRRIKTLEDWLGTVLFDRSTTPISLTPAGEEFVPQARRMIAETEALRSGLRDTSPDVLPTIRLATSHRLSLTAAPRIAASFLQVFGPCQFSIEPIVQNTERHSECLDALHSGSADFLLTYAHGNLAQTDATAQGLESCLVDRERIIPITSPSYREAMRGNWRSQTDAPLRYIGYPPSSFTAAIIAPLVTYFGNRLETVYESSFTGSIRAAVLEGIGFAWLPESTVQEDIDDGRLVVLEGGHLIAHIDIVLYRRKNASCPTLNAFWRHAAHVAGASPDNGPRLYA